MSCLSRGLPAAGALLLLLGPAFGADLQTFPGARLEPDPHNDGDSFLVSIGEEQQVFRLYFVDCPETSADSKAQAQRVREQKRYFGISDEADVFHFGREAKQYVEEVLSEPFTLHTGFVTDRGGRRYYAFVTTSTENDLASLLVAKGYARNYGIGRETPGGVSRKETEARLGDLEVSAMLKRAGVWARSDPDRIVALRAEQRREEEELERIQDAAEGESEPLKPIDVNRAAREELELIPGIGPVLAERIIAARPFESVDQLLAVRGIGPATLQKLRDYVKIAGE